MTNTESLRHKRITGNSRAEITAKIKAMYEQQDKSIRAIADEIERSYGFVHRVLSEAGVKLNGRGGSNRAPSTRVLPDDISMSERRAYADRLRARKAK